MSESYSRRTFIKAAAVSATAAAMSSCVQKETNSGYVKEPLHVGLMTYNLAKHWDIDTIIKNCVETKFEHVELRTTHAHGVEVSLTTDERKSVRKRFEDAGLAISLASAFKYHYNEHKLVQENIDGTKEFVRLAQDVGAIGIRVFPNALLVNEGVPEEQTLRQIGKALGKVGEFANDYGVEIRVCVHGKGTNFIPKIKKMLDYSESEHVYVNWNCTANDLSGAGFEANFDMVKDKIRGVHMHELWDEEYPYRRFFELMQKAGYEGYLNAEIPESAEPIRLMRYYRALFLAYQNII